MLKTMLKRFGEAAEGPDQPEAWRLWNKIKEKLNDVECEVLLDAWDEAATGRPENLRAIIAGLLHRNL